MNATLDWGNTRLKLGLFEGQELRSVEVLETTRPDTLKNLSDWLEKTQPASIIWTASGEVSEGARALLSDLKAFHFNHQTPVPHSSSYLTPQTLGLDRILLMVAVGHLFPKTNVLVIDMGTCITYDFLSDKNIHEGGGISPGWKMRLKAMHQQTSALPEVEAKKVDLLGRDTTTSLQSGAYNGMRNEMQETIRQYESRYPNLYVVLTGGDGNAFDLQAKKAIFARPNLTLFGLNAILLNHAQ